MPGFAANVVVSQSPAPGTRVIADGAPIIVLRLSRNGSYRAGGRARERLPVRRQAAPGWWVRRSRSAKTAQATAATPATKPAKAAPKAKATPKAKPAAAGTRTPAFKVAGAPPEPLDEIVLSARAKQLAAWVEKHPHRTAANVDHWLYQHTWIVTGAGFGWADGAAALRTLIAVDNRVQKLWGVGCPERAGRPPDARQGRGALAVEAASGATRLGGVRLQP